MYTVVLAQKSQEWVNKTRLGESERSMEDSTPVNKDSSQGEVERGKLSSDEASKSSKDKSKER